MAVRSRALILAERARIRLRFSVDYVKRCAYDVFDLAAGRREDLVPPTRWMFDGSRTIASYKEVGAQFLRQFIDVGQLEPHHRVLEVGSGIGRNAVAMTSYLTSGTYDGLDVVASGVRWCQAHVTARYPQVRFQRIDVYSRHYNPRSATPASQYRFPFPDASFDFVIATSLFTHLLPPDAERYLREMGRVSRDGGRCFLTFFLLNDESRRLAAAGRGPLQFRYGSGVSRSMSQALPDYAVAYEEPFVRQVVAEAGFALERVCPGAWCGRPQHLSFQDVVVARRMLPLDASRADPSR